MTVSWKVNEGALRARLEAAQARLAQAVLDGCAPYVPYDTGALAASGHVEENAVVYDAPHARRVYYGGHLRFSTAVHPLAAAQWFEVAKAAHGGEWIGRVQEALT